MLKPVKKNIRWIERDELFPRAKSVIKNVDMVLDIGCGIRPQDFIKPIIHICADPFDQYIEHLQKKLGQDTDRYYIFLKATWRDILREFSDKSVDTIFLIDVVEHLEKKEALSLIKKSEKIAKKQIIIFTPLGFLPQYHSHSKDAWGLNGGKWQNHLSGWKPEDFDKTWKIYASSNFHQIDNSGKPFKIPFGAFFAIKTFKEINDRKKQVFFDKSLILEIHQLAIAINNPHLLRFSLRFLSALNLAKKWLKSLTTVNRNENNIKP